jgi:hypothetical protein
MNIFLDPVIIAGTSSIGLDYVGFSSAAPPTSVSILKSPVRSGEDEPCTASRESSGINDKV